MLSHINSLVERIQVLERLNQVQSFLNYPDFNFPIPGYPIIGHHVVCK